MDEHTRRLMREMANRIYQENRSDTVDYIERFSRPPSKSAIWIRHFMRKIRKQGNRPQGIPQPEIVLKNS